MKKTFIVLMANMLLAIAPQTSLFGKTMGEVIPVPIRKEDTHNNIGRPHAPELPLFNSCLNTDSSSLIIYSAYDVDEVSAVIENLTTGELYEYSFDSSDVAVLPISGSEGLWYITLSLIDGTDYIGEFEL